MRTQREASVNQYFRRPPSEYYYYTTDSLSDRINTPVPYRTSSELPSCHASLETDVDCFLRPLGHWRTSRSKNKMMHVHCNSRTWFRSLVVRKHSYKSARVQNKQNKNKRKKERCVCDSQIMRQRKGATIIINERPKEVAGREQSKAGMMDGWMMDGMDFVRKVSTTTAKGKKRVGITPNLRKRVGVVRYYSRGQGGISGTAGISGTRAAPPGLWAFRFCCYRSRCSCSACIVARICNCCAMKSDVFGLEGHPCKYRMRNPRFE
jgi:hypothetical protein